MCGVEAGVLVCGLWLMGCNHTLQAGLGDVQLQPDHMLTTPTSSQEDPGEGNASSEGRENHQSRGYNFEEGLGSLIQNERSHPALGHGTGGSIKWVPLRSFPGDSFS